MDHGPGSMQRQVVDEIARAHADPDVRCVVVTGAGRAFSSGGMMGSGAGHPETVREWLSFLDVEDDDNERIRDIGIPVIGAINGLCYGAGLMMAVHFDILVAAQSARFGLIETRFGSVGADVLTYLVGPQWAKFLALSGELIDSRTAQEIGLVLAVVEDHALRARTQDLARRVASLPPESVELNRRLLNAALNHQGWNSQKATARALNAITNSLQHEALAANGRKFTDLMKDGWPAYKAARDEPFSPPWLQPGDKRTNG